MCVVSESSAVYKPRLTQPWQSHLFLFISFSLSLSPNLIVSLRRARRARARTPASSYTQSTWFLHHDPQPEISLPAILPNTGHHSMLFCYPSARNGQQLPVQAAFSRNATTNPRSAVSRAGPKHCVCLTRTGLPISQHACILARYYVCNTFPYLHFEFRALR